MERHVFDLDNTLIYTNTLNNESYNYALKLHGIEKITNCKRITRELLYRIHPELNTNIIKEIIKIKQDYFVNNLNGTKENILITCKLKTLNKEYCVLWTSADEDRAKAMLEHYKMENLFKYNLYSNKKNVRQDIEKICKLLDCGTEQVVFYENNQKIINKLQKEKLKVIII